MNPMFFGLIRHVLTAAGGSLATYGVIAQSDIEPLVGALITIVGLAWSAYDKKGR